jgi:hypothetical protein
LRHKHSDEQTVTPTKGGQSAGERPRFTELRRGLVSAALGFAAYYGSRALGASALDALLIGTLVCVVRAAYTALNPP